MDSTVSPYLFVYSSLRKGFRQSAYDYLTQFFRLVSPGKIKGILSDLGDQVVATPVEEGAFILGELYLLNVENGSYVFGQLDDYEGLVVEENESVWYRRELTKVFLEDGSMVEAWVYWYNGEVEGKPIIPSGDVLDYVRSKSV